MPKRASRRRREDSATRIDAPDALVRAVASPQFASLLDLDLWRAAAPGGAARFDERRFGHWLETLTDEDPATAVRFVAAMDSNLAIAGLSRYVRVFDPGVLAPAHSTDDGVDDPRGTSSRTHEADIGGYVLRARTARAWDAIVGVLVALADDHPDTFHALMRGCRRLSDSTPEIDGLDELLQTPEQFVHDLSVERERRLGQRGYVDAGDARAFLQMARQRASPGHPASVSPIAAAYFRELDGTTRSARAEERSGQELAFLANALLSGCSVQFRPFTSQDAWNAAVGICSLGLDVRSAHASGPGTDAGQALDLRSAPLDRLLEEPDLVSTFETGWRLLHEDVGLFVADRLIATLAHLQSLDLVIERDLVRLRRDLGRHRDARAPWLSLEALDVIAILDTPAWVCLRGLLSECPVMPDALPAILGGKVRSVNADAFECFATREHIHRAHAFADRLGDMLVG